MTPFERWEKLREAHIMLLRVSDDRKLGDRMDHAEADAIFFEWNDPEKISYEHGVDAKKAEEWARQYRSFIFRYYRENSVSLTAIWPEAQKFFINNTREEAIEGLLNEETLDEDFRIFIVEQMRV